MSRTLIDVLQDMAGYLSEAANNPKIAAQALSTINRDCQELLSAKLDVSVCRLSTPEKSKVILATVAQMRSLKI